MLPIATVLPYAGQVTPQKGQQLSAAGWFPCDGRWLDMDLYQDLFDRIGSAFTDTNSQGSHQGTFQIPDLCGRALVGSGLGPGSALTQSNIGETGGEEQHALVTNEIPQHSHDVGKGYGDCSTMVPPNVGVNRLLCCVTDG